MAATQILATNTTAASSSEITLTTDTLVGLKQAAIGAEVIVKSKDDGSAYNVIGKLTSEEPAKVLAPGIYLFTRVAGASCGVYQAA